MFKLYDDEFIEWVESYNTPIPASDLHDEWPDFPTEALVGVTVAISEGEACYYHCDLLDVAQGRVPLD